MNCAAVSTELDFVASASADGTGFSFFLFLYDPELNNKKNRTLFMKTVNIHTLSNGKFVRVIRPRHPGLPADLLGNVHLVDVTHTGDLVMFVCFLCFKFKTFFRLTLFGNVQLHRVAPREQRRPRTFLFFFFICLSC